MVMVGPPIQTETANTLIGAGFIVVLPRSHREGWK